jgi:hypothetical protein
MNAGFGFLFARDFTAAFATVRLTFARTTARFTFDFSFAFATVLLTFPFARDFDFERDLAIATAISS